MVKKVLGAAAPIVGGLIGGPAGAAIGSAVGGLVSGGGKNSPQSVGNYLNQTAQQASGAYLPYMNQGFNAASHMGNALGALNPGTGAKGDTTKGLENFLNSAEYRLMFGQPPSVNDYDPVNAFRNDPGYQFRMDEGLNALQNSAAARGNLLSGNVLRGINQYAQGVADQEYNNYLNRVQNTFGNYYNRLAGMSGTGLEATGAANNFNMSGAAARAQGMLAQNNAQNQSIGALGNALSGLFGGGGGGNSLPWLTGGGTSFNPIAASSGLPWSDVRLKRDITFIGREGDIALYSFRYRHDPDGILYRGVLAQQVAGSRPDAVEWAGDYLSVDYDKLGIEFGRVH